MHVIKVDINASNGGIKIYCPYCKSDLWAKSGYHVIEHDCIDAGFILFMNGYAFVGVPNYLAEEKANGETYTS